MPAVRPTPAKSSANEMVITRSMRVADILSMLPSSATLLAEYGLHCVGCHYNGLETLEEGVENHGFQAGELDDLLADLNLLLSEQPERPMMLSLTPTAAKKLKDILANDGKDGWGLRVGLDEHGGFCMEAAKEPDGDKVFLEPHHEGLRIFASELTLRGIGGATIDFRDERFKLDLPEDKAGCVCGGGSCGCKH